MPTVHDGIGTWYYGKDRIHTRKGTCKFCNSVEELRSYDTTLYFVFFFIPLVPLGKRKVFDECPSCTRHRVMSEALLSGAVTDPGGTLTKMREMHEKFLKQASDVLTVPQKKRVDELKGKPFDFSQLGSGRSRAR